MKLAFHYFHGIIGQMDSAQKVLAAVALTSLLLGAIGALLPRRGIGVRGIALLAAIPSAVGWTVAYGIWGWQHRLDPEHIRNYPLEFHIIQMTFMAVLCAALGFVVAFGVATRVQRLRTGFR